MIHGYFGEGNGTPLQYSCLEDPMEGRAWWAAVHEVAKLRFLHYQADFFFFLITEPPGKDWGDWCAAVLGVTKSQTRLSN